MIYIIIAAAVLAADIFTKILAENALKSVVTIPIIKNIFHLTYVENRGIAFGLFSGGRIVFVIVSVIVLAILSYVVFKTEKPIRTVWLKGGSALIFGGAIGNMIERIAKGYVVDFLDFRIIDFPVFNIADIAVVAGAIAAIVYVVFFDKEKPSE